MWTLDFTTPPHPVEGRYGKILLVRDLSSGLTLLSLACEDETARTLVDALRALFAQVGAPLVVKMDNGSAQRSGAMRALLREYGVIGLFSPPYTAKYNGAAEAGIGGLKTRAHHLASAAGRPEEWTLDDLEEARCLGNELGRPAGASAPTPEESWRGRVLPTPAERASFRTRVARTLRGVRHPGPGGDPGAPGRSRSDAARRTAISRALTDAGILEFRTRRIPQPVSTSKRPVFS